MPRTNNVTDEIVRLVERAFRRHAFDNQGRDLDGAYGHFYKAMDHLHDAKEGKVEFDEDIFNGHMGNANDCLKAGAADEVSEAERDRKTAEAADSALALDGLFQRDQFLSSKLHRRSAKPSRKRTPVHAHDDGGFDIDSLFQVRR